MAKSLFIEGMDGSGKSTQIALLKKLLEERGEKTVTLREPGGSDYFEALRTVHFSDELKRPPVSDALLTGAGRAANIQLSRQALADGAWLLSDRAYPSTYAYQVAQGVDRQTVELINSLALDGFSYDVKILLDLPVSVARARVENTGVKKDHWESRDDAFFDSIRKNYLSLAEEEGHIVINGENSIEQTHALILEILGL